MSKKKDSEDSEDYEDYEDYKEETEDEADSYPEEENKTNEDIKAQVFASDFDTERVLYEIKKIFNGFEKRQGKYIRVNYPLARSEFLALFENSLRAVINFHSMFSQNKAEEAAFSMMEGLNEITFACVDYGVKEEHIETFVNMYDNLKSAFYGITIDGRGTENIKQVLTSVYKDLTNMQGMNQRNTAINWDYIQNKIKQ